VDTDLIDSSLRTSALFFLYKTITICCTIAFCHKRALLGTVCQEFQYCDWT